MNFCAFFLMQSIDSKRSFHERISRALEQVHLIEEHGFHSIWLGEHHFSQYSPLSRPFQVAAFLAARTKKIRAVHAPGRRERRDGRGIGESEKLHEALRSSMGSRK